MSEFEVIELKELNKSIIKEIISLERKVFKEGSVSEWTLPIFIKYGCVFLLLRKKKAGNIWGRGEVSGVAELIRSWSSKNLVFIVGFSIQRELQGQGWGKYFLEQILAKLKKDGVSQIQLSVSPKNLAALKLYRSFGFKETTKINQMYGVGEDRLIFCLDLK